MTGTDQIITSTANTKVKRIRALSMKKHRDDEGVFIVEGLRHIEAALENGWQIETLAYSAAIKKEAQKVIEASRAQKAFMLDVTAEVLSHMTHRDNAQPIVGVFVQKFADIDKVQNAKPGLWLGLENIRDPGNLGTIMRTADAVGASGILLIGNTCDPWSPEVIRATMGSFAVMPLIRVSLEEFLQWRANFKGAVLGTHLHQKAVDYSATNAQFPALLLMGSEQSGLSPEICAACDTLVKIPMRAGVESLNLAISTGIMLYELSRGKIQHG